MTAGAPSLPRSSQPRAFVPSRFVHSSLVAFNPRSLSKVKVSGVTRYFWRGGRVTLKTSQPIVSAVASRSSPMIGSSIFSSFLPGIRRGIALILSFEC